MSGLTLCLTTMQLIGVASCCVSPSQGQPTPTAPAKADSSPLPTAAPASNPSASSKMPAIRVFTEKTKRGAEVWQVGKPFMGSSDIGPGILRVSGKSERVYGLSRTRFYVWHGPTGQLLYSAKSDNEALVGDGDAPIWYRKDISHSFALKPDLTADSASVPRAVFGIHDVLSHDKTKYLAWSWEFTVRDLAAEKYVAKRNIKDDVQIELLTAFTPTVAFSTDDKVAYWAGDSGILKWNWATDQAVTVLLKQTLPADHKKFGTLKEERERRMKGLESPSFAAKADLVAYGLGPHIWFMDMITGKTRQLMARPDENRIALGLSATGKYIAIETRFIGVPNTNDMSKLGHYISVFEVATGKHVSEHHLDECSHLVFASDVEEVFACSGSNLISYVDMRKPPEVLLRTIMMNWLGDDALSLLVMPNNSFAKPTDEIYWKATLPGIAITPSSANEGPPDFIRPAAAPKWVTGFEQRQGGPWIGFNYKGTTTCKSTLKVWVDAQSTSNSMTRQFRMSCTGPDAGWQMRYGVAMAVTRQQVKLFDGATGQLFGTVDAGRSARAGKSFPNIVRFPELSADGKFMTLVSAEPVLIGGDSPYDEEVRCKPPIGADAANPFGLSRTCSYELFLDVYALPMPSGVKLPPPVRLAHIPIDSNEVIVARFNTAGTAVYLGRQDGRILIEPMPAAAGALIPPFRTEHLHNSAVRMFEFSPSDRYVHSKDELGLSLIWPQ
jgi:hypothetical protein